jgi:hypothetical protein
MRPSGPKRRKALPSIFPSGKGPKGVPRAGVGLGLTGTMGTRREAATVTGSCAHGLASVIAYCWARAFHHRRGPFCAFSTPRVFIRPLLRITFANLAAPFPITEIRRVRHHGGPGPTPSPFPPFSYHPGPAALRLGLVP